jgi:hypothetical protein
MTRTSKSKLFLWSRALLALTAWSAANSAFGWIYPEHRDIAMLAVEALDPERKAVFDRLWQDARTGDEQRLCAQGADTVQGLAPSCIDWAALSAIAGDHSCSSKDMLETVRTSGWILIVADVAAQLKIDLARIPVTALPDQAEGVSSVTDTPAIFNDARRRLADAASRAQRLNALRTADNRLQRADPAYATRADANLAHFVIPRPDTNLDPYAWAKLALSPGSPLNATGVYAWFHLSALYKAGRLGHEQLTPDQRRELARSALFDEAIALHFLEDMYAAGHVAGSWGNVSQRKGTHDFYNQNGLEAFTWKGRDNTIVLMGDAHMRPQDAELTAKAVRTSLEQVLDAAIGRARGPGLPINSTAPLDADDFDICKNVTFPAREEKYTKADAENAAARGERAALEETLLQTPVPGLGPGLGAQPRARSEVGVFTGLAGSIDARNIDGGFVPSQNSNGWMGGLDIGFRAGVGLEGAMGDSGDGLVFGQIGFRSDSASTNKATGTALETLSGTLSAAIPARSGLSTRIRMPFYLIPGDLLLLSPLYLFKPDTYTQMAVTAGNGGLIPWQQGWSTSIGRFQFVLGRELGATWYGLSGADQLAAPSDPPGGLGRVVNYKSVFYDLPILEYRPYRSFGSNQSSTLMFQLFAGADVPYDESVESPVGAPPVKLRTIYSLGLRMVFDWRYYY